MIVSEVFRVPGGGWGRGPGSVLTSLGFRMESLLLCRRLLGSSRSTRRPRSCGKRRLLQAASGGPPRGVSATWACTQPRTVLTLGVASSPLPRPPPHLGEWGRTLLEPAGDRTGRICIPSRLCLSRGRFSSPEYLASVTFPVLLCKVRIIRCTLRGCSEGLR